MIKNKQSIGTRTGRSKGNSTAEKMPQRKGMIKRMRGA
jgi:hypothetical protein